MTAPNAAFIKPRFKESLDRYVTDKWQPGRFLTAVLSNDLMEAIGRGDADAIDNLPHIAAYIYNHMPTGCHGSAARVREWLTA